MCICVCIVYKACSRNHSCKCIATAVRSRFDDYDNSLREKENSLSYNVSNYYCCLASGSKVHAPLFSIRETGWVIDTCGLNRECHILFAAKKILPSANYIYIYTQKLSMFVQLIEAFLPRISHSTPPRTFYFQ